MFDRFDDDVFVCRFDKSAMSAMQRRKVDIQHAVRLQTNVSAIRRTDGQLLTVPVSACRLSVPSGVLPSARAVLCVNADVCFLMFWRRLSVMSQRFLSSEVIV